MKLGCGHGHLSRHTPATRPCGDPCPPHELLYLMVPVGEGRGLMRWAMVSGMLMVRGEMWACTGFTGDSGASCFSLFSLDRAVNVILMFVLGNLNVHLKEKSQLSAPVCQDGGWASHLQQDTEPKCPQMPLELHLVCKSHREAHFKLTPCVTIRLMNERTKRHFMTLKH